MSTYRKINEWRSHSRDMVESFKRYYHNSFLDSQRQEAYNLFLGNYVFAQGQPMLWDLPTDYYLHHSDPRLWSAEQKHRYIEWYNPEFLEARSLPPNLSLPEEILSKGVAYFDDYWLEYYRPLALSSFAKIFSWKMSSRPRYLPDGSHHPSLWDPSPFVPRKPAQDPESPGKKPRKGVTILDPHNDDNRFLPSSQTNTTDSTAKQSQSILRESMTFDAPQSTLDTSLTNSFMPADKNSMNQWTLNQFHENSLNPSVTAAEEEEYEQYISHPLHIPLVISAEEPTSTNITDSNLYFFEYVRSGSGISNPRGSLSYSRDGQRPEFQSFDDFAAQGHGDGSGGHFLNGIGEEDFADYAEFLTVAENPLDVTEEDKGKKRYKAYRQWLRGKSLFKQSKVDMEAGR
jgi:phosphatidylinositol 3,5-bisphosphate 5-phosphatase